MITQDLHIELDMLLQRINSHWNTGLLPQEKDLFLNREITRFINRRISRLGNKKGTGLFDTIKRTVELSPLLVTRRLPVIYGKDLKEVKVLLPFDFSHYVTSEVSTCCSCKNLELADKVYYEVDLSPIKELSSLPLTVSQGVFDLTINDTDIPSSYLIEGTIPYYNNKVLMIEALQVLFAKKNGMNVEVIFDKEQYKFIFRSLSPFTVSYIEAGNPVTLPIKEVKYKGFQQLDEPLYTTVDVIDEEFSRPIKNSYLSGATPEKALVAFRKGELLYTLNGVIADYVHLTYLRKPKKINLLLQSNSELTSTTLEEIASDTAQRIMGVLGTDNYAKYVEENSLME